MSTDVWIMYDALRVRTGPKSLTQKVPLSRCLLPQRVLELVVVVVVALKVPRRGKHSLPPPSKVPFPPRQVSEKMLSGRKISTPQALACAAVPHPAHYKTSIHQLTLIFTITLKVVSSGSVSILNFERKKMRIRG